MPFALLVALTVSLGAHVLALFGTDIDLSTSPEPPPIVVELPPPPAAKPPLPPPEAVKPKLAKKPVAKKLPPPVSSVADVPAPPGTPEAAETALPVIAPEEVPVRDPLETPVVNAAPTESRLPAHGMIRYRVDRGDQGFVVGQSTHDWEIADGAYRITSVTETSGLAAFFKPLRIELESRGRLTADGLQPESFVTRRGGRETKENARFDWAQMQVHIGKRAPQPLGSGAQDLLSFHYQLGFLTNPAASNTLPIATGKKYLSYRFDALGDEEIEIPAGIFRTLHLRAAGDTTTELWLAYDYLLLPVKIRHLDRDGDSFVQVATEIRLSKE